MTRLAVRISAGVLVALSACVGPLVALPPSESPREREVRLITKCFELKHAKAPMVQQDAALLQLFRVSPRYVMFNGDWRRRLIQLGQESAMETELLAWCRELPVSENTRIRLARFYAEAHRTADVLSTLDAARPLLGTNKMPFDDNVNFIPDTLFMSRQYELAKRYDDAVAVLKIGRKHMPNEQGLALQAELDRILAVTARPR